MPFGAQVSGQEVRFALFAPAARRVELCLEGVAPTVMTATAAGWFELRSTAAGPGSRYRFRIDGGAEVPDPASRFQPAGVHGPSEVVDPRDYRWQHADWRGRPWEELVIYELHVGTFTAGGNYAGVVERLGHLRELGVTALELMPLGAFPGCRGWGYDGVLPFAPSACYDRPEELKTLIDAAHAHGLMVFIDVIYNHFGPEGNYLHAYAPQFFTADRRTPWGEAIAYQGEHSRWVREFFIHNALYWLEEYRCDGLRLDAVHAIVDGSEPHILTELARRVRSRGDGRHVHLILENDDNATRFLDRGERGHYDAQWNDDLHHALHVLLTGETTGYYRDYATAPLAQLGRSLAEGFAWQGEWSSYRGRPRGESTGRLPATAFVGFLQNHDQIGNRARGERIETLSSPERLLAALAILLLAPSPPLLFMGQEWACAQPFPYFCDFGPELAAAVSEGRRRELSRFEAFRDDGAPLPDPLINPGIDPGIDPGDEANFRSAILDWEALELAPHREWLTLHRELLALRAAQIVPRLRDMQPRSGVWTLPAPGVLALRWRLGDGSLLQLLARLGEDSNDEGGDDDDGDSSGGILVARPEAPLLWSTPDAGTGGLTPWSVCWYLTTP